MIVPKNHSSLLHNVNMVTIGTLVVNMVDNFTDYEIINIMRYVCTYSKVCQTLVVAITLSKERPLVIK